MGVDSPLFWVTCPRCGYVMSSWRYDDAAMKLKGHVLLEHDEWMDMEDALESVSMAPDLEGGRHDRKKVSTVSRRA